MDYIKHLDGDVTNNDTSNLEIAHMPSPGPWRWTGRFNEESITDWDGTQYPSLRDANGTEILSYWSIYAADSGLDVSEEDARIIEASWEMLQLLRRVALRDTDPWARVHDLAEAANELIARIEGKP